MKPRVEISLFDSIVLIIERLNVRTDERHLKTSEGPHYIIMQIRYQ